MNKLIKLQKQHSVCGTEENFTNYCFLYGTMINEYRNDTEREVFFNIDGVKTSIVMIQGKTITTRIHN